VNKAFFVFYFLSVAVTHNYASADTKEKYCLKTGTKTDVHLFGQTFESESQRKLAAQSLTKLKSSLNPGDKIRIFTHSQAGFSIWESCVPGCPEKSFSERLFDSCSVQVAKKDRILFDQNVSIRIANDLRKGGGDYDIFNSIYSLKNVYKNTSDTSNVYAVISMIPKGIDPTSRKQLNELLVRKNETIEFPQYFPPVQLLGASTTEELLSFWNDIFKGKAKFNFQKY
jgi:hypothetical protein